jgi:hypothetical protein
MYNYWNQTHCWSQPWHISFACLNCHLRRCNQGYFFWLQNTEGEPVVGGWLQIHQPQVLPPYFAARKKNPGCNCHVDINSSLFTSSYKWALIGKNSMTRSSQTINQSFYTPSSPLLPIYTYLLSLLST